MELLYKINWSKSKSTVKLGHKDLSVYAWSSSNIFAFTTENEVKGSVVQCLNFVNPNQPWGIFSANYNNAGVITCAQWNSSGTKLLTGDSSGTCCVWEMVNSMSNNWKVKTKFQLAGEEILSIGWLHHGVRVLFHTERKDASNAISNFDRPKFTPSLMKFGGKAFRGCVAVTSSGKAAFKVFTDEGNDAITQNAASFDKTVQLNVACHQEIVDISYTSQGKITFLLSDGHIEHLIQFFEVQLSYNEGDNKLNAEVTTLPSLLLQCAKTDQSVYTHITEAKFASYENQDYVLACVSGPTGSLFEAWLLRKEVVKLHRIFQNMLATGPVETTKHWINVNKSTHMARVKSFDVPSLSVDSNATETKASQDVQFWCGHCITVACADNTIKILHRIYLKPYVNMQYQMEYVTPESGPPSKRIRTSNPSYVQKVAFSKMCCAVIALDNNGSMLLYKVPPWLNTPGRASTPQALQQIVQLLLYCLVTGCDWWDVLLHLNPHDVNNLIELLTVEVSKQVPSVREMLHSKLMVMKITIYHISNSPLSMDCHLKLLFEAISLVFRTLNRPHQQVMSEEKDPAVKLQTTSCTSPESDINKLVHNVDTDPQTLQSLQQLIQWIADVSLYLLASVPLYRQPSVPGVSLLFDRAWLSILREMLVLIRVWGLLKSACSPLFVVYDGTDVISYVFQIITLLWKACGDDINNKKEISPEIVAKCRELPMHVMIPPLKMIPHPSGIIGHKRQTGVPFKLVFGEPMKDTELVMKRDKQLELVATTESTGKIDMLRWISLGKKPTQSLKECTRCGITAMYHPPPRAPIRVWEQRFIKYCICGGNWKKV